MQTPAPAPPDPSNDPQDTKDLSQLRSTVRDLDRQILALVARRLETSRKIGQQKSQLGLPIRDFKVEVEVMARARRSAEEFGFDGNIAERVLEILISSAVQTQVEHQTPTCQAGKHRVLVIGGAGRMGSWLCPFLASQGHQVEICDPQAGVGLSWEAAKQQNFDTLVLSTPLANTPSLLAASLDFPGSPLIFDIASLKGTLADQMLDAAKAGHKVASVHPMFAPGTTLLMGRTVLICDAGCPAATEAVCSYFSGTAVSIVRVPIGEHDRFMSGLLGLSHAVNLIFGRTLDLLGLSFLELGKIASTTFSKQAQTAAEVSAENPELYYQIQHLNPHTTNVYQALFEAVGELRQASLSGDPSDFLGFMERNRQYFFSNSAKT